MTAGAALFALLRSSGDWLSFGDAVGDGTGVEAVAGDSAGLLETGGGALGAGETLD
jgi:hypothetical protein